MTETIDPNNAMPSVPLAEKSVLSVFTQFPGYYKRALAEGLTRDMFFVYGRAFDEIGAFIEANGADHPIDLVVFVTNCQLNRSLDALGGASKVADIFGFAVTPDTWDVWIKQMREAAGRRLVLTASVALQTAADCSESYGILKATTDSLQLQLSGRGSSVTGDKAALTFFNAFERDFAFGDMPGHPTGVAKIDDHIGGMKPGELWCIGGKPSQGKSVLMLQVASSFLRDDKSVAIFSLEMQVAEVMGRLVSVLGRIPYDQITNPKRATKGSLEKMKQILTRFSDKKLSVDDSANQSLNSIVAEAERIRDRTGSLDLVVVDYIQLVRGNRQAKESREEEVARVSGGLKQLSKKLGCPVFTATQLNAENQTRESRAIEQDCDCLMIIADKGIEVAKLRNGIRNVTLPLLLDGSHQRFV
jgi:replicative DNA helicase